MSIALYNKEIQGKKYTFNHDSAYTQQNVAHENTSNIKNERDITVLLQKKAFNVKLLTNNNKAMKRTM